MCLHYCSGPRRNINRNYPHFPGYSRVWVRPAEELTSLSRKQNLFSLNNVVTFSKKLSILCLRIKVCWNSRRVNPCLVVGMVFSVRLFVRLRSERS